MPKTPLGIGTGLWPSREECQNSHHVPSICTVCHREEVLVSASPPTTKVMGNSPSGPLVASSYEIYVELVDMDMDTYRP